jgi:transposase-like protein
MVGTDPLEVDRLLLEGLLLCPGCEQVLRPWGWARSRSVREVAEVVVVRPRRSRCASCSSTHVLLPELLLARRADTAAVIGEALTAKATGRGHRSIADLLGRPVSTVRAWLRRFAAHAESLRVLFTGLLFVLDPEADGARPAGSLFADAVEAVGLAAAAAVRMFGPRPAWQFASSASRGLLLGPVLPAGLSANTS